MLMLVALPWLSRWVVTPGSRARDSAMVVSGSLPMSSAEIVSSMTSAFSLTLIALSIAARMPVTTTSWSCSEPELSPRSAARAGLPAAVSSRAQPVAVELTANPRERMSERTNRLIGRDFGVVFTWCFPSVWSPAACGHAACCRLSDGLSPSREYVWLRRLISVNMTDHLNRLAQCANPPAYVFMPSRGPHSEPPAHRHEAARRAAAGHKAGDGAPTGAQLRGALVDRIMQRETPTRSATSKGLGIAGRRSGFASFVGSPQPLESSCDQTTLDARTRSGAGAAGRRHWRECWGGADRAVLARNAGIARYDLWRVGGSGPAADDPRTGRRCAARRRVRRNRPGRNHAARCAPDPPDRQADRCQRSPRPPANALCRRCRVQRAALRPGRPRAQVAALRLVRAGCPPRLARRRPLGRRTARERGARFTTRARVPRAGARAPDDSLSVRGRGAPAHTYSCAPARAPRLLSPTTEGNCPDATERPACRGMASVRLRALGVAQPRRGGAAASERPGCLTRGGAPERRLDPRRSDLRDLSARLLGRWQPGRRHRTARPPAAARRHDPVADADPPDRRAAQEGALRQSVRGTQLCGDQSAVWHGGRPARPGARRTPARHEADHRPGRQPHLLGIGDDARSGVLQAREGPDRFARTRLGRRRAARLRQSAAAPVHDRDAVEVGPRLRSRRLPLRCRRLRADLVLGGGPGRPRAGQAGHHHARRGRPS